MAIYIAGMKTTIDLPDDLLRRAKILAAERQSTLKDLVVAGLSLVLKSESATGRRAEAIERLKKGLPLGGRPLGRQESHERR